MKTIDVDRIRDLVRQALKEKLSVGGVATSEPDPMRLLPQHPSQLDVMSCCADEDELKAQQSCLIEPHRMCCNSGYCKKLGF